MPRHMPCVGSVVSRSIARGWARAGRSASKRAAKECKGAGYKVVTRSDDAKEEDEYPFGFNPAGYLTRTMLVICR